MPKQTPLSISDRDVRRRAEELHIRGVACDKRVFITKPLPKKAKLASTSEGDEDPWCHVHPDGNHLLKDCRQVKCLAVRAQRQADGVGPGALRIHTRTLMWKATTWSQLPRPTGKSSTFTCPVGTNYLVTFCP